MSTFQNKDIVILCDPQKAAMLRETFETYAAARHLDASVLYEGRLEKSPFGILVLEWEQEIPLTFIQPFAVDPAVLGYAVYDLPTVEAENAIGPESLADERRKEEVWNA